MHGTPIVQSHGGPPGPADHEIKFVVPPSSAQALRAWTASVCRRDTAFPLARVATVYFDTPGLTLLAEKIDSDYLKTKVRVRWYGAADGATSRLFAEAKQRIGSRRVKTREALETPAATFAEVPLCDARWTGLLARLIAAVPTLPARLSPVLSLTYTRHRFVDVRTGARVSIDEDIRVVGVNAARLTGRVPVGLDPVVFEHKGRSVDLPSHLRPLMRFGARRHACSKYLLCYQAVTGLSL